MTTQTKPDLDLHIQALSKAKIQLMARPDSAFFTTICFSLMHKFTDQVPTAATDGRSIFFNPKFFLDLDPEERVFLLLHESMHCAYIHSLRRQDRDPGIWNQACDYVINWQLDERGFKMPKCGLLDAQYKDMSAEEVYKLLHKPGQGGKGAPGGFPALGADLLPPPPDMTPEELEESLNDIVVRASIQSRMADDKPGTIPGQIALFLDKLLNPKLPWHRILAKYLNAFAKGDYSFKKPNRRYFPTWHLPSLHSRSLMDIAVAVDISGSVSDEDFKSFINEVAGILRLMKPSKITFIQFDTVIHHLDEIRSLDNLMAVEFSGRGGTDIKCVLDWANNVRPKLLLFFSDGGFGFGEDYVTRIETIWMIHNNPQWTAPFGKVIHYDVIH